MPDRESPPRRPHWLSWLLPAFVPLVISIGGTMTAAWYTLGSTQVEHGVRLNSIEALQAMEQAAMRREIEALTNRLEMAETGTAGRLQVIEGKLDRLMFHLMQRPSPGTGGR